jgi:serine/threonine protein kinase
LLRNFLLCLRSNNSIDKGSICELQIGDFGISKILSSKSKAYTVVGTPSYISPELCEGRPYNQKSDIWSLGCILYEMCALKRAFEAPTLPALVLKIMRGNFQPLPAHYSQYVSRNLHDEITQPFSQTRNIATFCAIMQHF